MSPDRAETIRKVLELYVRYDRVKRIQKAILAEMDLSQVTPETPASGFVIRGDTGVGKTSLIRDLQERVPERRIFVTSAPPDASPRSLAKKMLADIQDPLFGYGDVQMLQHRLVHFLQSQQVKCLVIDEFQHFADRERELVNLTTTDWLKLLHDELKIPIVLLGLPESVQIVDDPGGKVQLSRRFPQRYSLEPFSWDDEPAALEFLGFLKVLQDSISAEKAFGVDLADQNLAYRLFCATRGVIHWITICVKRATVSAIVDGSSQVGLSHLARAFDQFVASALDGARNPFATDTGKPPKESKAAVSSGQRTGEVLKAR